MTQRDSEQSKETLPGKVNYSTGKKKLIKDNRELQEKYVCASDTTLQFS